MFALQKREAQEAVPPPSLAAPVIQARAHAVEMQSRLDAQIAEWDHAQRVKADSAAGEEAWHEADLAIERLLKSIPRARINLNRAKAEVLSAERVATAAYTEFLQTRWRQDLPAFVKQYVRPLFEAHQRLYAQHDRDLASGVSPGSLPTLCYFLLAETPTRQSGLTEWLRTLQREGMYPLDDWLPIE